MYPISLSGPIAVQTLHGAHSEPLLGRDGAGGRSDESVVYLGQLSHSHPVWI